MEVEPVYDLQVPLHHFLGLFILVDFKERIVNNIKFEEVPRCALHLIGCQFQMDEEVFVHRIVLVDLNLSHLALWLWYGIRGDWRSYDYGVININNRRRCWLYWFNYDHRRFWVWNENFS